MANKYSKYQLRPAVSNYVDPGSVKVNEILRERYDQNKAQKDLLDRTLSGINTLQGDQYIMENAKSDIRNKLSNIVSSGAYEDAGLIIQESITDLAGNKGVKAAQMSYENRQKELDFITKQRQQGIEILDFGKFKGEAHKSYMEDENGKFVTNVYQPLSEPKLEYDEKMKQLFSSMKSNTWGITDANADKHATRMYGAYINSKEGAQDFRRLVELEYDESIPFDKRKEMAEQEIRQRMQTFARAHVHTKVQNPGKASEKYRKDQQNLFAMMLGEKNTIQKSGVSLNIGNTPSLETGETTTLSMMSGSIEAIKNKDYKAAKDMQVHHRKIIDRLESSGLATKEQADLYRQNNISLFEVMKTQGFSEEKSTAIEAYIKYATTDVPFGDGSTLDPYMKESWNDIVNTGGKALGAGAAYGITSRLPGWLLNNKLGRGAVWSISKGVAAGYATAKVGEGLVGRLFDQRGNVRGWNNPENQESFGAKYLGLDTEMEDLMQNLTDVDHINRVFGLEGDNQLTTKDTDLIKTIGSKYLEYMQKEGDALDELIDTNGGGAVDYAVELPDLSTPEGAKGAKMLDDLLGRSTINNFRVYGMSEGSPEYEALTEDGTSLTDFKGKGIIPPSLVYNTPLRLSVLRPGTKTNGGDQEVIFEPKIAEGAAGMKTIAGQYAKATGNLQYAVVENVQQMLQDITQPTLLETSNAMLQSTQLISDDVGLDSYELRMASYKHAMNLVLSEMPKSYGKWLNSFNTDYAANAANVEYKDGQLSGMDERQTQMYREYLDRKTFGTFEKIDGQIVKTANGFVHRSDIKIR
tara:strand:+ start:11795 stop:14215 length:2421 start_codon:yes stop_codon:yes gene_type:complete